MEDVEAKLARLWQESATDPHILKTRASILIIDDEPWRHRWINRILKNLNDIQLDVRSAYNADQALEQMAETTFDLVFFDHDLGPGLNGSRLATQVLGSSYGPSSARQYKWPLNIFIHSQNENGAQNIESKFKSRIRTFRLSIDNFADRPQDFSAVVNALIQNEPIPF